MSTATVEKGAEQQIEAVFAAVAVFTRTDEPDFRNPAADHSIGPAAALAVAHLRSLSV